jgi:uncharacterized membrane-anchored protein YhcB (DUF1043 family)
MRHERLAAHLKALNSLIEEREAETSKYYKSQADSNSRLIHEAENKADTKAKLLAQADESCLLLNQKLAKLVTERDELQGQVMCF